MGTEKQATSNGEEVSGFQPDYATPPGWTLEEWLNDNQLTAQKFAETSGIPARNIKRLIAGKKKLSASDANKLEAATSISANLWNEMERIYREALIRLRKH